MITNLNLPNSVIGPTAVAPPVSTNPGGAVIYVQGTIGLDTRRRLSFQGTAATTTQSNSAQGPYGDPNKPMASVFGPNGALTACLAGRGDCIIVLPGHAENLPAGVINVPFGVSILGIGYGKLRPTFSWTVATSAITVAAGNAGIQFSNLLFDLTQVASVAIGFNISGDGVEFVGCKLLCGTSVNGATITIQLNAGADDFVVSNCEFDADGGNCGAAIVNPAANNINRPQITYSWFHGNWGTGAGIGPIQLLSTGTTSILIANNVLTNTNTVNKALLSFPAGNTFTGSVTYNNFFSAGSAVHTTFINNGASTGLLFAQNFGFSNKGGPNSAILIPDVGTIP